MEGRRGSAEEGPWRRNNRETAGKSSWGHARSYGRSRSGSDSLSWRKETDRSGNEVAGGSEKGEEVTSPPKAAIEQKRQGTPRNLQLVLTDNLSKGEGERGKTVASSSEGAGGQASETLTMEVDEHTLQGGCRG